MSKNTGMVPPPGKTQSYNQPAFSIGPLSDNQRNVIHIVIHWQADGGLPYLLGTCFLGNTVLVRTQYPLFKRN